MTTSSFVRTSLRLMFVLALLLPLFSGGCGSRNSSIQIIHQTPPTQPTLSTSPADPPKVIKPPAPQSGQITVKALIDGNDQLKLCGGWAQWWHMDNLSVVPGGGGNNPQPTTINGAEWFPKWDRPNDPRTSQYSVRSDDQLVRPALPKGRRLRCLIIRATGGNPHLDETQDTGLILLRFNNGGGGARKDWCEVTIRWETME